MGAQGYPPEYTFWFFLLMLLALFAGGPIIGAITTTDLAQPGAPVVVEWSPKVLVSYCPAAGLKVDPGISRGKITISSQTQVESWPLALVKAQGACYTYESTNIPAWAIEAGQASPVNYRLEILVN